MAGELGEVVSQGSPKPLSQVRSLQLPYKQPSLIGWLFVYGKGSTPPGFGGLSVPTEHQQTRFGDSDTSSCVLITP